jgi:hypothetical protein
VCPAAEIIRSGRAVNAESRGGATHGKALTPKIRFPGESRGPFFDHAIDEWAPAFAGEAIIFDDLGLGPVRI